MSLTSENYVPGKYTPKTNVCYKLSTQFKRFKVHVGQETHTFPWAYVFHSTLSKDEGEIRIHLPQYVIEIIGSKLKPIHEAIFQDSLEYIRALPQELLSVEATETTNIEHIEIQSIEALSAPSSRKTSRKAKEREEQ